MQTKFRLTVIASLILANSQSALANGTGLAGDALGTGDAANIVTDSTSDNTVYITGDTGTSAELIINESVVRVTSSATLDVDSSLNVDGNVVVDGTITDGTDSTVNIGENLDVNGRTTTNGITNDGTLTQNGNTTITGTATISSTLSVTGTTATNGIDNGNDGITNTGAISGATTISASSTISTSGTVQGEQLTSTDDINAAEDITAGGQIAASNADIGTGGLDVDGFTELDGLNVDGNSTLDSVTAVGTFSQTGTTNINTTGTAATTIGNSNTATAVTATAGNSILNLGNNDGSLLVDGHGLAIDGANDTTTLTGGTNTSTLTLQDGSTTLTVGGSTGTAVTLINATTNNDSSSPVITLGNINPGTTVNNIGGAGYSTINNSNSTLATTGGSMVQTSATSATIRASESGALATNGTTGVMSINTGGGYTTYQSSQTIAAGTTIGNILEGAQYTNQINGNLLVDGNVYISGTLNYVSSNAANTSVVGGGSVLTNSTQGTTGGSAIVMKDTDAPHTVVDSNGRITNVSGVAAESSASLTLTNGYGETHGIIVTESQTTISGGTQSSSLTLNDNGANFSDSQTGAPIQVHGVADGTADFDAVNVRQFAGAIAATAAMSNVPQVPVGENGMFGVGAGTYMGKYALAMGVSYRFADNGVLKLSTAVNSGPKARPVVAVGAGWSW